jgi:hypothetical protein
LIRNTRRRMTATAVIEAPKKPKKKSMPCGCGCGEMTRPGPRYIRGHQLKKSHAPGSWSPETIEAALQEQAVARCALCPHWLFEGTVLEGREMFRRHRVEAHGGEAAAA